MTPIYCKEEGLEGLQQRYIKVHGLCRLPRAHANAHDLSPEKDRKCCDCKRNLHAESPEGAPISNPLRHCQKGQYMLVRIPPHCKVRWRGREGFHDNLRRFHSKERRSFIEVGFGRSIMLSGIAELNIVLQKMFF
jgi:hypothetical protein